MKFPVVDGHRTLELGTVGPMRQRLNDLVLDGHKRATAGTLDDYNDNDFEYVGERLVLVDDAGQRVALLEVTLTSLTTFGAVPFSFALAEGEGDTSIDEWRNGHRRYWENEGLAVNDDTPVYLIYFTVIDESAFSKGPLEIQ